MSSVLVFALTGVVLILLGLYALLVQRHLLRKVLAFNVISSGIFLLLAGLARRTPGVEPDPVPQAMVLTGIVVAVAATALALAMIQALRSATGRTRLDDSGED
ncbi:MAG: NADH-quinone oxidoreductase subunit K [Lamprobacter sp.]|uniref:NADH-quinone oxidoreductase subunit K n=1 Tax=Lamprobacter sp. TaxID=3100796 RepID=UPI002B25FC09|nr:NADH-quinone oxidoreductase subunit K [Lamprobacter sp.]MEA3638870.1 NADH-quinone oxidoreductase subunit K [Lamprobacter sp.]